MAVCDFSDQPRLICFCPEHKQWRAQAIAVKNVAPRVIEETANVEEQALYDTFDWDDLDDSEHNFMADEEFLTTVKAQHREQLPLKPLALLSQKTTPWVKPRNVKVSSKAKGVECEVCKEYPRRPEFFVCHHCQAEVEALVKNLPKLMVELDVKVERMDRTHSGNRVVHWTQCCCVPPEGRVACSERRSACVLRTRVGLRAPHDGRHACSERRSACVL